MTNASETTNVEKSLAEIRHIARPLEKAADLDTLASRFQTSRFVCIGEASHGTHEFYLWRSILTSRLIQQGNVRWIGVEGDWPDCWRLNRWVRGKENQDLDAIHLLATFERWPTWMWANQDVAGFLSWLREWNLTVPEADRVGFYGLDVYSLWDSLRRIMGWLEENAPDALPAAAEAWQCFQPYNEDPHQYAWSTRLVPTSCEKDVVELLRDVHKKTQSLLMEDDEAFDAEQNATIAVNAEAYYRAMVRGDRASWNIRDNHMADTIDFLARKFGDTARGIVWEHNTHIGDARATDMASQGLVNVGQLVRDRHAQDGVALVGFASHRGTVLAGAAWGAPEEVMELPAAQAGSHEDLLHHALGHNAVMDFSLPRTGDWSSSRRGHRAVGVVYNPESETGNYVASQLDARYDALLWCEETTALQPLRHEPIPTEAEYETEPTGF